LYNNNDNNNNNNIKHFLHDRGVKRHLLLVRYLFSSVIAQLLL